MTPLWTCYATIQNFLEYLLTYLYSRVHYTYAQLPDTEGHADQAEDPQGAERMVKIRTHPIDPHYWEVYGPDGYGHIRVWFTGSLFACLKWAKDNE